ADPGDAMDAGIGMVHQHFMLGPVFTVAENIVRGHEPTRGGLLDIAAARTLVREISARFGFDLDPDALVEDLPVGAQQRVEIIKALSRRAEVLVLDEPTAVLTPQETDELMTIMRQLRDEGTSIVFITHKLREVKAVSDRITVIRRGQVVGEADPSADQAELASLMVGRQVSLAQDKAAAAPSAASPSRCATARCSPSPASRATDRPSWPRRCWAWRPPSTAPRGSKDESSSGAAPSRSSTPVSDSSPRTAPMTPSCPTSP